MRKKKISESKKLQTNVEPNVLGIPGLFVRGRNSKDISGDTRVVSQKRIEGDIEISDEVVISRTSHGFPTVYDLSLLFYLFDLYQQQGYPDQIEVSLRSMAEFLGKSWGGINRGKVLESLDRLGTASYLWKSQFHTPTDHSASRERFTLLSYSHQEKLQQSFADTDENRSVFEKTFVKLASQISNNLKVGFSIPIDLETFRNLTIDLSKQVYAWACSRLRLEPDTVEKSCRIPSLQLFEELSIGGTRYRKKANRKDILVPAVEEINGKSVPQGFIQAVLEEEQNDVVLVLKIQRPTTSQVLQDCVEAYELVVIFLQAFGRNNRVPSQSEVSAAMDFLASYPLPKDTAERYLQEIAQESVKLKYHPDWFSGIKRNLIQKAKGETTAQVMQPGPQVGSKPRSKPRKKSAESGPGLFDEPASTESQLEEDLQEKRGEGLFKELSETEQYELLEGMKNKLLSSKQKAVYSRWSPDLLDQHVKMLIYKELGQNSA